MVCFLAFSGTCGPVRVAAPGPAAVFSCARRNAAWCAGGASAGDAYDQAVRDIDALIDRTNCTSFFLDVGSNIGVQVRKLYELYRYPASPIESMFAAAPGLPPRCAVCALSFEPNPKHTARLTTLSSRRPPPAACSCCARRRPRATVRSRSSARGTRGSRTASTRRWRVAPRRRVGDGADAAAVGAHTTWLRRSSGRIAMKMDVEGVEGRVVPDLIGSGALCELAAVIVEWHDANPYLKLPSSSSLDRLAHARCDAPSDGASAKAWTAAPILFDVDDETYRTTTSRGRRARL